MKVLIVDDSKTMRALLSGFAQDLGFEITAACDGRDALEQIARYQPFDAVLLDWDMPNLNGFELLQILRANPTYNDWKIVMVTSQNSQESVANALEAGATDFLMKPLNEEMFVEKMQQLDMVP